jgi:hypothetical protein
MEIVVELFAFVPTSVITFESESFVANFDVSGVKTPVARVSNPGTGCPRSLRR